MTDDPAIRAIIAMGDEDGKTLPPNVHFWLDHKGRWICQFGTFVLPLDMLIDMIKASCTPTPEAE